MHSKPELGRNVNPFQQLDQIIRELRSPGGCPWDQKQTGPSLKKYLLEEAAELAEAIDNKDQEHIREEIGDMYFILALLALIYEEQDGVRQQILFRKFVPRWCAAIPMFLPGKRGNQGDLYLKNSFESSGSESSRRKRRRERKNKGKKKHLNT